MSFFYFFFFNDTATTEIYTLSLHDALPIWTGSERIGDVLHVRARRSTVHRAERRPALHVHARHQDRKSTRLNSSHANISYAVFCLKKKKNRKKQTRKATAQKKIKAQRKQK